jgi:hypothetical protein
MGYPHSMDAHVTERYIRPDHNDLQLTITVDDPTIYSKPFTLGPSISSGCPINNSPNSCAYPQKCCSIWTSWEILPVRAFRRANSRN